MKQQSVQEAQSAFEQANEALTQAQTTQAQANDALSSANAVLEQKKTQKTAADNTVAAAQAEVAQAQEAVNEAQAEVDAAQAAKAVADQKVQQGSFAFFETMGSSAAIQALTGSTYASRTVKGDPVDATSLENMKNSIQYMRECNELRARDGLGALQVNDTMMAMAQADANYSDTVVAHAMQFNIGENCAWNGGNLDPFVQWYDEEKDEYEATGDPSNAGHYFNIIDSNYQTTGFAICTRRSMNRWLTYTQVFDWAQSDPSNMSIDAYEARFLQYYESIVTKPQQEIDAKNQVLEQKKAVLAQKQQLVADANAAVANAQAEFANAEAAVNAQTQVVNEAQAAVAEKKIL